MEKEAPRTLRDLRDVLNTMGGDPRLDMPLIVSAHDEYPEVWTWDGEFRVSQGTVSLGWGDTIDI